MQASKAHDEDGRSNLKDLMKGAFEEHQALISEIKSKEAIL